MLVGATLRLHQMIKWNKHSIILFIHDVKTIEIALFYFLTPCKIECCTMIMQSTKVHEVRISDHFVTTALDNVKGCPDKNTYLKNEFFLQIMMRNILVLHWPSL